MATVKSHITGRPGLHFFAIFGGVAFCYSGFSRSTSHYIVPEVHRGEPVFRIAIFQSQINGYRPEAGTLRLHGTGVRARTIVPGYPG